MAFDKLLKHLWKSSLDSLNVQANVTVGTLDLSIDLVIRCEDVPPQSAWLPDILPRLGKINILEFKSARDKIPQNGLLKGIAYAGLFCFQEGVSHESFLQDVVVWFITTRRPQFLRTLIAAGHAQEEARGIYCVAVAPPHFIVVINELPLAEENFPLLLLASGEQLRGAMDVLLHSTLFYDATIQKYIYESFLLNYEELKDMTETEEFWPEAVKQNIRHAIEDLGLKEVIENIGLKEVVDAVGVEEIVRVIGIDEMKKVLQALEENPPNEKD